MDFDPNKALAYAQALARPRLVGSGEDERVAQEVVNQLKSFGYTVDREPFQYTRAFDLALNYEIGLALALVLLALLWPPFRPLGALLCVLLLQAVAFVNPWIQRRAVAPDPNPARPSPFLGWGRLYRTANIVARPSFDFPNLENRPHFYLVAHFDSKSQRLPLNLRVTFICMFLVGIILFITFSLARADFGLLSLIIGLVTLLSGAPLLLLGVGNDSPGAIDNASGMGLVLHMAEVLQTRPDLLERARLTILITSAEEMATMGALHHVQRHLAELHRDEQRLTVLNFDGVGVEGQLHWAGPLKLGARLSAAARDLRIWLRPFRFPGLLFDHMPFVTYGVNAATLLVMGPASWQVHTPRDSADQLQAKGFEQAAQVALRVIEQTVLG